VCEEVVRGDDEVDRRALDIEQRILSLFALQSPVASDLRLLTALLHINLHLERIADQAVNLAKITCLAADLPQNPAVLGRLQEMGELAVRLCELDDPHRRAEPGHAGTRDGGGQGWSGPGVGHPDVCRVPADRAGRGQRRGIGEQVAFVVSGQFQEFNDASHPEIERPGLLARDASRSRPGGAAEVRELAGDG
jgi:phosphate transport system protein